MAETNEKKEVKTQKVPLGKPKKLDPNFPQAEVLVSKQKLDARQEKMGVIRKYAGPESDEETSGALEELVSEDVPPTDCKPAPVVETAEED